MDTPAPDPAPVKARLDDRAFRELVEPHRARLWGVCLAVTGNPSDAEDALQECLIAAWRSLPGFRGDSSFSTWIYRIAVNASRALLRRRRELAEELGEYADPRHGFDERIAVRDRVQRALAQLSEDRRVALVLREYGELSYNEIAEQQGIPVQTVKSRISRARDDMRRILSEEM